MIDLRLQSEDDSSLGCNNGFDYLRAVVDHNDYEREYDIRELFPTASEQGFFQPGLTGESLICCPQMHQAYLIRDGRLKIIAGVYEQPGYRDGPGHQALMNCGGLQGITYGRARTSDGAWYFTDGQNGWIRKLTEQADGSWMVSSFVQFTADALLADVQDNLWTVSGSSVVRISPDGKTTSFPSPGGTARIISMRACDDGSLLLITRNNAWDVIYRFHPVNGSTRVAGMNDQEVVTWCAEHGISLNDYGAQNHDGAAINEATFHSVGIFWASPDGNEIWTGDGDELQVRRVKNGRVESLLRNGTWAESSIRTTQPHEFSTRPLYVARPVGRQENGYPWSGSRIYIPHGYRWVQKIVPVEIPDPTLPKNKSQFVDWDVPSKVGLGQEFNVKIRIKNIGTGSWSEATKHRLGAQNPHDNKTWGVNRISLPVDVVVMPGEIAEFNATVKAPSVKNKYNFQWGMVQEAVEWFGDKSGVRELTPNLIIDVQEQPQGGETMIAKVSWTKKTIQRPDFAEFTHWRVTIGSQPPVMVGASATSVDIPVTLSPGDYPVLVEKVDAAATKSAGSATSNVSIPVPSGDVEIPDVVTIQLS